MALLKTVMDPILAYLEGTSLNACGTDFADPAHVLKSTELHSLLPGSFSNHLKLLFQGAAVGQQRAEKPHSTGGAPPAEPRIQPTVMVFEFFYTLTPIQLRLVVIILC